MKIYSEIDDQGKTSLLSGERVAKNHPYIEACGDVDELISVIAGIRSLLPNDCENIALELFKIQSNLMTICSYIATSRTSTAFDQIPCLSDIDVKYLEKRIESMQLVLPELKGFIIPNGHISAVMAHIARTVCRRAERHVVGLSLQIAIGEEPKHLKLQLIYLNRLSDYLFVLARFLNLIAKEDEYLWRK